MKKIAQHRIIELSIGILLLGILVVYGYFRQRFHRLNIPVTLNQTENI